MPGKPAPGLNRLLASLSAESKARLFPHLESVALAPGDVLYEAGDTLSHVYFPEDALITLLCVMENGDSAEISVVGKEGVIGISLFTGGDRTPGRAIVLSGGSAWQLERSRARDAFVQSADFQQQVLRYLQLLMTQMAQTAVCNRHHSIQQQLCRWLLLCLDRLPGNELAMTQELIANMLGVRREGVTQAARKLQSLGAIEYARGKITVRDRPRLESLSCECYGIVKKETDRLLSALSER